MSYHDVTHTVCSPNGHLTMCEVSSSYKFGKGVADMEDSEEEEEEVSIKEKRTKIRGFLGCWPEHLINLEVHNVFFFFFRLEMIYVRIC